MRTIDIVSVHFHFYFENATHCGSKQAVLVQWSSCRIFTGVSFHIGYVAIYGIIGTTSTVGLLAPIATI